jgi:tetratricopeptide (TPR) repeat protein
MDAKTTKLLQQAGRYILLGKLNLALEQYLKIHETEPGDTTIINSIGDLYSRLDDKENALVWYHKLAEMFESRELYSNAIATYRKILKFSPKNQEAITLLAQLYERQEQIQNARTQYQILAKLKIGLNEHSQAIGILKKICRLDPRCAESRMTLAKLLELSGATEEALQGYLETATAHVEQGNLMAARQAVEDIFRLSPDNKEFLRSFFLLLQKMDLTERGLEYLQSRSLDGDPEFRLILSEKFLQEGSFEAARKLVQGRVRECPALYRPALRILQGLIARKDLDASLEIVEELFETSVRLKDEATLQSLLDSLVELGENNVRVLKALTAILIRMNEREKLESYLKRLVILQMRANQLRDARDSLNKLVVHGQSGLYVDLSNLLNEAMLDLTPEALRNTVAQVILALEKGSFESHEDPLASVGLALGISELDLGMGMTPEEDSSFLHEMA